MGKIGGMRFPLSDSILRERNQEDDMKEQHTQATLAYSARLRVFTYRLALQRTLAIARRVTRETLQERTNLARCRHLYIAQHSHKDDRERREGVVHTSEFAQAEQMIEPIERDLWPLSPYQAIGV